MKDRLNAQNKLIVKVKVRDVQELTLDPKKTQIPLEEKTSFEVPVYAKSAAMAGVDVEGEAGNAGGQQFDSCGKLIEQLMADVSASASASSASTSGSDAETAQESSAEAVSPYA